MRSENNNILIAPLDWGLGHTTRCIPVIAELIKQEAGVFVAGNETQIALLKEEFPRLNYILFPGYNVRYGTGKSRFVTTLLKQAPGILQTIKTEHRRLKQIVTEHKITGIISDNRFGLYHKTIPSVFITHQLRIRSGKGRLADNLAQRINYKWMHRFSELWIPDFEAEPGLAGALSHPKQMPEIPASYIGPLSRMQAGSNEKTGDLLVLISGPEPQRTLFENNVYDQLKQYKGNATLVRGLPAGSRTKLAPLKNVAIFDHLPAAQLNDLMNKAAYILCRSGYSSVMDINTVAAKSVLVPTPGQTEQEYLALLLNKEKRAVAADQEQFNLAQALAAAREVRFASPLSVSPSLLTTAVKRFLAACAATAVNRDL